MDVGVCITILFLRYAQKGEEMKKPQYKKVQRCANCMNCHVKIKLVPPSEDKVNEYFDSPLRSFARSKVKFLLSSISFREDTMGPVRCTEKMWLRSTYDVECGRNVIPWDEREKKYTNLSLFYKRADSQERKYDNCPVFVDAMD